MQNYNHIVVTEEITEGSLGAEPISLSEMKNYLRLDGFIDDDDATAIPKFTEDDALIGELITMAREVLEEKLGVSIIEHSWRASGVTNQAGMIQLEYGPVTEITAFTDSEGDEIDFEDEDVVKRIGDYIKFPCYDDMTIEYTAGYAIIPRAVKVEIKRMVAWMYEHRGDEDKLEGYKYSDGIMRYSRRPIF